MSGISARAAAEELLPSTFAFAAGKRSSGCKGVQSGKGDKIGPYGKGSKGMSPLPLPGSDDTEQQLQLHPQQPQQQQQQQVLNQQIIQKLKQQQLTIDDQQKQINELHRQVTWMLSTLDRVLPLPDSAEGTEH